MWAYVFRPGDTLAVAHLRGRLSGKRVLWPAGVLAVLPYVHSMCLDPRRRGSLAVVSGPRALRARNAAVLGGPAVLNGTAFLLFLPWPAALPRAVWHVRNVHDI